MPNEIYDTKPYEKSYVYSKYLKMQSLGRVKIISARSEQLSFRQWLLFNQPIASLPF